MLMFIIFSLQILFDKLLLVDRKIMLVRIGDIKGDGLQRWVIEPLTKVT